MIETDFSFKKDMKGLRFKKGTSKKNVRGYPLNDMVFVNLSAVQWKGLDMNTFICLMGETITHEILHILQKDMFITNDTEERICKLMADQLELKGVK